MAIMIEKILKAYEEMAESYNAMIDYKAHNAFYDRCFIISANYVIFYTLWSLKNVFYPFFTFDYNIHRLGKRFRGFILRGYE